VSIETLNQIGYAYIVLACLGACTYTAFEQCSLYIDTYWEYKAFKEETEG
jgi:hypothetical protein